MKILSIETSSNIGSIAILENEEIKKEIFFESSDIAQELVKMLDLIYNEFDYLVISIGPGSWTGIRIGISFAKGLVLGEKKIYCVNIFESLFYTIKDMKEKFLCLVHSSKDIFYYSEFKGRFRYNGNFKIKLITVDKLIPIITKKEYFLIGPGVLKLKEVTSIPTLKTIHFLWYPRASLNGLLAFEKIKRKIPSPLPEPIYGK